MKINEKPIRLVARLDIKGPNLIKGVHLEGLRVMGDPQGYARDYYEQGADEFIYIDIVASLYERSISPEVIQNAAKDIFVPLTVGGGIRSIEDVKVLLRAGADKVAINTGAILRPGLITEISRQFGSQCMVLSIEAKQVAPDEWEILTDCGREYTGINAVDWAIKGVELGAGEILITSIDREGTRNGFDLELIKKIANAVDVPIIVSGGYGNEVHLKEAVDSGADAIAFADAIHYSRQTFADIRKSAKKYNIPTRKYK